MTKVAGLDQLSVINQKVVGEGEVLPQVLLKDGSQVQTGTVATMLHNIELYNAGQRGQIEEELKIAIPTLVKVGLFDLFQVDEWINGTNAGRTFVGMQAKTYLQQKEQENN
ncbi:DUF7709 family protein [Acinetobacter sp. yr461]|uniref:DUF7709 family protein n=1 Tax=Acinetobacter sp. yr461 TaxID=1761742 RepID=UPI0008B50F90|nr:hypothetical protein [Acinetobacter sp. yr461]SEO76599.1 hypothetical protein SAMN04487817_11467 [Acinetobacter sp. yr461]